MKQDITEEFCMIDDFVKEYKKMQNNFELQDKNHIIRHKTRTPNLSESEIICIVLLFQKSPCKNFKFFYNSYAQLYKSEFPKMPSYARFVALMPRIIHIMLVLLYSILGKPSSKNHFIDSTSIAVCSTKRISRNKLFKHIAKLGKTTKGWFFGFKLHIVINTTGELVSIKFTKGNTSDVSVLNSMSRNIKGRIFGDKGYISRRLFLILYNRGLKLITSIKKTMKNSPIDIYEKIMLRKRSLVETVFDFLKNKLQLEHTRHRSTSNFLLHIISTLVCYQMKKTKPSVSLEYMMVANP